MNTDRSGNDRRRLKHRRKRCRKSWNRYSQDAFGNTVARPGPLIDVLPFEPLAQGSKTWSSERGLRYSLAQTSGGAKAQVGTGLVMNAPLKYAGWVPRLTNDLLGVGFVRSQSSATTQVVYHDNEYVLETFYTLQLSPTSVVQPDLQVVWGPAFNPDPGPAVVFQVQFMVKW